MEMETRGRLGYFKIKAVLFKKEANTGDWICFIIMPSPEVNNKARWILDGDFSANLKRPIRVHKILDLPLFHKKAYASKYDKNWSPYFTTCFKNLS